MAIEGSHAEVSGNDLKMINRDRNLQGNDLEYSFVEISNECKLK